MIIAKWITKNGKRIKLVKGNQKNIHDDYYSVKGDGEPLHVIDRRQAFAIARAKVRVNRPIKEKMNHDWKMKVRHNVGLDTGTKDGGSGVHK